MTPVMAILVAVGIVVAGLLIGAGIVRSIDEPRYRRSAQGVDVEQLEQLVDEPRIVPPPVRIDPDAFRVDRTGIGGR
jgi:hypothetical protein